MTTNIRNAIAALFLAGSLGAASVAHAVDNSAVIVLTECQQRIRARCAELYPNTFSEQYEECVSLGYLLCSVQGSATADAPREVVARPNRAQAAQPRATATRR